LPRASRRIFARNQAQKAAAPCCQGAAVSVAPDQKGRKWNGDHKKDRGAVSPGRRRGTPPFRSAQGGGGAARTDWAGSARISGAASPGRRRGMPPFRSAQGGGGAARTDWAFSARISGAASPGRRRGTPPFRSAQGGGGASRIDRSMNSLIKCADTREEEGCRRFCHGPSGRRRRAGQETYLP
jgi:hypothetical protein